MFFGRSGTYSPLLNPWIFEGHRGFVDYDFNIHKTKGVGTWVWALVHNLLVYTNVFHGDKVNGSFWSNIIHTIFFSKT